MAVKIRLKRMGKIRAPYYRVVVMDGRTKRDGRAIEEIGKYHPTAEPSLIDIDSERVQHWLSHGAQPTEAVQALLRVTGDWQRYRGLDGAEGTLKVAPERKSKKELYEAAVAAAGTSLDMRSASVGRRQGAGSRAGSTDESASTAEPSGETAAPVESAPDAASGEDRS